MAGRDPRVDLVYRLPRHHKPGQRTATTMAMVAVPLSSSLPVTTKVDASEWRTYFDTLSNGEILRGFFDARRPGMSLVPNGRGGGCDVACDYNFDDDEIFPPGCDRGATVRRLATVLPQLFWVRREEVARREWHDLHRMATWWELDDARAMLGLARRHCDEAVAADVALMDLLERRVQFYQRTCERSYARPCERPCERPFDPWWRPVVAAKMRDPATTNLIGALRSRLPTDAVVSVALALKEEEALEQKTNT